MFRTTFLRCLIFAVQNGRQVTTLIHKYRLEIIGALIGAIGGYMYYHYVGCASGTCPITSRPLNSTLYGALLGGLLFSSFEPSQKNLGTEK